ncbi:bifunctional metallophosphatase/5'-nucleotidase [Limnobacter parvus]|uniref:Bifunctional metallophosphatase/5'-nucleotidase n=1 Tax=Limnobacter parvus TaxID=2939690 RepID=A0ABT1XF78_9BURK|nr:bifunctional metallophosphatase/5'-nucleotidase [Limnobacter parvus]MCR2745546.1 bifunctional metallophosphatase/5'-nucleotidase [Limnobacter parvus]
MYKLHSKWLAGGAFSLLALLAACSSDNATPVAPIPEAEFTLQMLHFADADGDDNQALNSVANMSGLISSFRAEMPDNTLVLSSGDNLIPGPRLSASEDATLTNVFRTARGINTLRASIGRADIAFLDAMGVQASALGNHDLDLGTSEFRTIFGADIRDLPATPDPDDRDIRWDGGRFPYLSFNADFSADANLAGNLNASPTFIVPNGETTQAAAGRLTGWVTATVDGETIGIIGASSPTFPQITSSGGITFDGGNSSGSVVIADLIASIQTGVDEMTAAGIDKIILLSHMQQISVEEQLAAGLRNVDIIVAGGSNTRLGNSRLRAGEASQGEYPRIIQSPTNPVALVNVDGDYKYLGRLVAPFDADGQIIPQLIDRTVSDAYATSPSDDTAGGVTPIPEVVAIRDALRNVITAKDGNVLGTSEVYLDGRRTSVRTEETNLGNASSDANLAYAQLFDATAVISLKNGGGIRSDIGFIETLPGSTTTTFKPIAANPGIREEGEVSQLAIENSLRFNNGLVVIDVTATRLKELLEHGVAAVAPGATPGQFPQIGGFSFSFDATRAARMVGAAGSAADGTGSRIRTVKVGNDIVVQNGALQGDPNRIFRLVTLNFLANISGTTSLGGDNYPFPLLADQNRLSLDVAPALDPIAFTAGNTFAAKGSEQDAFARFLRQFTDVAPFNLPETPASNDLRIQNLAIRADTVAAQ